MPALRNGSDNQQICQRFLRCACSYSRAHEDQGLREASWCRRIRHILNAARPSYQRHRAVASGELYVHPEMRLAKSVLSTIRKPEVMHCAS
jgi:hypothetical protein